MAILLTPSAPPAAPAVAPPAPPPSPHRSLVPGLVLAGVTVVGIIGGAALLGASVNKHDDAVSMGSTILAAHRSCVPGAGNYDAARCPGLMSALHADDAFHDVAVGVLVTSGAAAVGAIVAGIWSQARPRVSGHEVRVTPVLGSGDGGVIVSGSF